MMGCDRYGFYRGIRVVGPFLPLFGLMILLIPGRVMDVHHKCADLRFKLNSAQYWEPWRWGTAGLAVAFSVSSWALDRFQTNMSHVVSAVF